MSKTIKIPGRIESVETGNVVTGANAILDDTKGKKQNVINEETDAELLRLDQEKQGNLTFDQTPTENSTNPVTSGGVYAADQVLSQAIEAILLLIPSAASELNKLVDLATMNSSISTATASFKGTYNLVSDLHLTVSATHAQIAAALDALSLDADNNDYAFVQVPNTDTAPTDIAKTERYKFNGENWAYEYDLNNSGFTTAQWNAINSGITALLVAKLSALPTNEALTLALAGKQDNLTFDNAPTAGSNNPVKSGGIYTRNNEIVALINALDAAKQDVLTFDTTPTNGSMNPVTSNGVYLAIQLVQTAVVALDGRMGTAETKISTAEGNIVNLQAAYAALTQSDIVVVSGALPSSGQQQNIIYRQPDQDHTPPQFYSDYMWNGTAWVLMATYNNAIDQRPKKGSQNLVTSGGIFDNMGALDVSELNATENPHTLKPYATLDAALADIPSDYQKGGMSIKYVQTSDNKYAQCRYMSSSTANADFTNVANWQGVDDEPIEDSDNLVKSGGIRNEFDKITVGKRQQLTLNEGYLSIDNNPHIYQSSNYHYSNPFTIHRGQKVTLTSWVNSTLPFTVIAKYDNEAYTSLVKSNSSSQAFEQKTYEYTAFEDTNIVVCGRTDIGRNIIVLVSDGTEVADKNTVNEIKENIEGLSGAVDVYSVNPTLVKGYFVGLNGAKTASQAPYCYTNPIPLNSGDKLVVNYVTGSSNISSISIVDASNNFISRAKAGISGNDEYEDIFIANKDCFVCLSFNYSYNYNIKVKKVDSNIQGIINCAEIDLYSNVSSDYYNYNSHSFEAGKGYWYSKIINVEGEKYLHLFKEKTREGVVSNVAVINFLDASGNLISALYSYISNSDIIDAIIYIPANTAKIIVNLQSNGYEAGVRLLISDSIGIPFEKTKGSVIWKEEYFNNNLYNLAKWYNINTHEYEDGKGVWWSIKANVDNAKVIQCYHQLISSANKATFTFFDKDNNFISTSLLYNKNEDNMTYSYCQVPNEAEYVLITKLTYSPHDKSRFWIGYNYDGDTHVKKFNTVRDMTGNLATGLCRVGKGKLFVNNTDRPTLKSRTDEALPLPYYDVNSTTAQYDVVDDKNFLQYRLLNKLSGFEKSFVPADQGYTRGIVGKSSDDTFFVSYVQSNRSGVQGISSGNKLEVTRDFETFTTIWQPSGNINAINVRQVKELGNGDFILFVKYDEEYGRAGYFRLSKDFTTVEHIYCTDLEGNYTIMNATEYKDGTLHYSDCYDWHIAIVANKVLCSEYGDRHDYGRVFYSEDCGETFKEIFRMSNHYNDGRNPDDPTVVTQTHIHGVMIDEYTGRLIVVAGEDNRGIYYSDKGIDTTDNDWSVVRIYDQLPLRHIRSVQGIAAQTFKDCIILGSDFEGFGGYLRLNKLEDGKYSDLDLAYECTPFVYFNVSYCSASSRKAENGYPALLCMTRENYCPTKEENENLNEKHYGRVIATFDGYDFKEIYKDTTFGTHTVFNEATQALESHKFSYCTRDMNCYICNNGDVVVKYAGRDFVYLEGGIKGYGDFSARVYIIKGAAKFMRK